MDSICMPTGCEDIFAEEDSGPAWPQWLEAFRVPDEPRAAAYEDTPAHLRAAIKTALALHQAHAGEMDSRTCRDERFPRRGFRRTATDGPAPFALVAFPASLRSPARLAAALMPAATGINLNKSISKPSCILYFSFIMYAALYTRLSPLTGRYERLVLTLIVPESFFLILTLSYRLMLCITILTS